MASKRAGMSGDDRYVTVFSLFPGPGCAGGRDSSHALVSAVISETLDPVFAQVLGTRML